MNAWMQVWAIARYDMLMMMRRRAPIILAVLMVAAGSIFINQTAQTSTAAPVGAFLDAGAGEAIDADEFANSAAAWTSSLAVIMIGVVGAVIFLNEGIPLDSTYKVRELLDAAPISRFTYLAGKVLAALLLVLGASLIGAVVTAALAWATLGAFDLTMFTVFWLGFGLPMLLGMTMLAVLLTSPLRTRRGAVIGSLVIMPIVLILVSLAITGLAGIVVFVHPAYGLLLFIQEAASAQAIVSERIASFLPILAAALIVPWAFALAVDARRNAR